MSVEKRPYVGTWRLNGQQLVQHTPDALVYVNGDLSVPGCPKCSGKINLQQFVTEVSVDAGVDPGSASATFTLSIPLHHTDSFARDAKFILRPGLEVHIYMRGYFPVKGLYSNLAEAQAKTNLEGSSFAPDKPVEVTESAKPSATEHYSPESFLGKGESLSALSPQQVIELNKLAANMETLHQYMEQLGREGVLPDYKGNVFVGNSDAYATGGHVEDSQHYKGQAVDLIIRYTTTDGKRVQVPRTIIWASAMKLRGNKMSQGGVGAYIKAQPKDGAPAGSTKASDYTPLPEWTSTPHYDTRGKATNWYWYHAPDGTKIKKGGHAPQEFLAVLNSLPSPDDTVVAWDKHRLSDETPPVVDAPTPGPGPDLGAFEGPPEPGGLANQAQLGPSLLEEMGLAGLGIEDTLAYPYYHVFHGVVTEVGHSYSGGVSTITVNCSSMLHFWQYHNMSTNASLFGARPTNSKNKMSLVGNNFTGMHPYAIIYSLHYDMAGAAGGIGWALSGKDNQAAVAQSGESLFSLNIRYWEKRFSRGTRLRMHGATGELFSTMAAAWLSRKSSGALTRALRQRYNNPKKFARTDIGSEMLAVGLFSGPNVRNAIEATRFAAQSKPNAKNSDKFDINILEMQAFVSNIGEWGQVNLFESTYESKLDVANKVCDITGFEFYQDVDGDFVFKPPMWNLDTSSSRVYRIEDIDIINISFSEKEPQVTYMTVKGSQFKNLLGTGMENEWGVRGQYIDYRLVAQFGWRPGSYETNYFNDPKSMFFAAVNRMDVMNVGINSASVTIPERPELRPGYPVYIPYIDCFYYCNSFAHSHSVGGQCTTALQLVGKRAKFYAPGETTSGVAGISAVKLGDTKMPERPLGVLDQDGKPRLSGFPNVVMALDPTAINPLFFVVGTDIENISDARVVKYLLNTAEQLGIIHEAEDSGEGGGPKTYTMTRTTQKGDGGQDPEKTEVRFYFDETDLNPSQKAGSDINIMVAAVAYHKLQLKQAKKDQADIDKQMEAQREINGIYGQIAEINRNPDLFRDDAKSAKLEEKKAALEKQALDKVKAKEAKDKALLEERTALEQSWRSEQSGGVGLLLDIIEQTSEEYRAKANFQNRGDLSSTINLLDMLSDKKATFSNGQQPGQYRYYSASHPDLSEQGPPSTEYKDKKLVDGSPRKLLPDREPPEILMYQRYPTSPFPGAAIPESELKPGKPEAGIKVLTGNPKRPGGEVLATSEITELMFSVQDVTVVKAVTTSFNRLHVSGMGSATAKKIAEILAVNGSVSPSTRFGELFGPAWNTLSDKVRAGVASARTTAAALQPPVSLPTDDNVEFSTASVPVGSGRVSMGDAIGDYKYRGSSGTKDLGAAVSKGTQAEFLQRVSTALAQRANRGVNTILRQIDGLVKQGNPKGREEVVSAFNQGFAIGAPSKATTRGHGTMNVSKKETTFSPVFPVSDARGYHVIGSYRYGRGVDIDPDGVFDQFHKHDIFSLLDKDLVDQILKVFVQGRWQDIKIPKTQEVTLGNGKKKIIPVTEPPKTSADAAKYLNDEALRQLRAANLSDKQILDYSAALTKGSKPGQLDFSLANFFADSNLDGVQKVPLNNAAFSLADLNFQQAGHVCACKAAEANTLLTAFGQAQFVSLSQAGDPAQEGFGSDPADAATRWVAVQSELAAAQWEQQQQALRGEVLDRGGSHVVSQFLNTFGIDSGGVTRDSAFTQAVDDAEQVRQRLLQEKANADTKIKNLGSSPENDQ